jgi:hypothetical protein
MGRTPLPPESNRSDQRGWSKRLPGPTRPRLTCAPSISQTRYASYTAWRFLATEEGDIKRLQDIDPPQLRLRIGA